MRLPKVFELTFAACLPLTAAACGGATFDDPSLIKGLRVLAVQKTPPYPRPGDEVDIKLVYWDGQSTAENQRNVTVAFSPFPCENPPGDLYFNCFASLGGGGAPDGGGPLPATSPSGWAPADSIRGFDASNLVLAEPPTEAPLLQDPMHVRSTTVRIGSEIISSRPQIPGVTPYGLSYVLFTACAGRLAPVPNPAPNTFPIGCFDETDDRQLGADDFVMGYTAMYVYDERVNNNPVVNDLLFDRTSLEGSMTADDANVPHVPSCKASDRSTCPTYQVKPVLDRATTVDKDDDPTARTPDGKQLDEQVWVAFYVTGGTFASSVRLINDATRGWNENNAGEYTAPATPGPVRLFAVVRDNRGGVGWAEGKIIVD